MYRGKHKSAYSSFSWNTSHHHLHSTAIFYHCYVDLREPFIDYFTAGSALFKGKHMKQVPVFVIMRKTWMSRKLIKPNGASEKP